MRKENRDLVKSEMSDKKVRDAKVSRKTSPWLSCGTSFLATRIDGGAIPCWSKVVTPRRQRAPAKKKRTGAKEKERREVNEV